MNPPIKSILPYFGGKTLLAPTITAVLGKNRAYWEPFCGGLSVLFAKPPSPQETINDINGDVINLARVLASKDAHELYDRLTRALVTDHALENSGKEIRTRPPPEDDEPDLERAYHAFISSWMDRTGTAGTTSFSYKLPVRWTPSGGTGPSRFASAVDSIPWWHERLRRVAILRRDGFEVLSSIDDIVDSAVYVDPPYLRATRSASRYLFDFRDDDHVRLADDLNRFKRARIVVSYYFHDRLRDLYPTHKWEIRELQFRKRIGQMGTRRPNQPESREVLIITGGGNG